MTERHQFAIDIAPLFSERRITYSKGIPDSFMPKLKSKNTLLRMIMFRNSTNRNTFVLIVGSVRSGKSWFALRLAEQYMKLHNLEFDVDKQCSFEVVPFLRWSRNNKDSCYVLDEAQLSMSARLWFTIQSRIFNEFCDIQGFRRNLLILTTPNISYIDKHARFLINYIVETTQTQGVIKWCKVKIRHALGKGYMDWIANPMKSRKPSKHIRDRYEEMKKIHNDEHLKRSIVRLLDAEKPNVKHLSPWEMKKYFNQGLMDNKEFRKMISVHGIPEHEVDLIIASKNKPIVSGYSHVCKKCGKQWRSQIKNPVKCPGCQSNKW